MKSNPKHVPPWMIRKGVPDDWIDRALETVRNPTEKCMPALTVRQPFAAALVSGPKTHENRSICPKVLRDTNGLPSASFWVAIHAGLELWGFDETPQPGWGGAGDEPGVSDVNLALLRKLWPELPPPVDLPRGAVLGAVEFVTAVEVADQAADWLQAHPWVTGPWAWEVRHRLVLPEPLEYKGRQGIWTLDALTASEIRREWKRQVAELEAAVSS